MTYFFHNQLYKCYAKQLMDIQIPPSQNIDYKHSHRNRLEHLLININIKYISVIHDPSQHC